jgi:hypothetical protein
MAVIRPYQLHPTAPHVALLLPSGEAVDEQGELLSLDAVPPGVRVYGSWDTVEELLSAGRGEAFCWDGDPIRWRHRHFDDGPAGWTRRPSDAIVIRLPFPGEGEQAISGLTAWRDWLAGYGASPTGSLGSSGMSLLRARIGRPLWTARGKLPPIRWTLGGRQQLGVEPRSSVSGATHLDLPAAYARTLGEMRYGGVWREVDDPRSLDLDFWSADDRPVFAHAEVTIPGLRFGPLPRRPRKRPGNAWDRSPLAPDTLYPTDGRLRGVWTSEELQEAAAAGCRVRVDRLWVHVTEEGELGLPFSAWWSAVQEGRAMSDRFGALLAKACANALWGQFCVSEGRRQLLTVRHGRRVAVSLPAPGGGMPRSWDLAELITGRVRARLAGMMRELGEQVVSVHTDGGWMRGHVVAPAGWEIKDRAEVVDLLGPQLLRYRRERSRPWLYRVSGVAPSRAAETFESLWKGVA